MPAVLVEGTVLDWSYGVLPVIAVGEGGSLYDTTAREAEHTRMHVVECLCQVLAHAVLTTLPRVGGEE